MKNLLQTTQTWLMTIRHNKVLNNAWVHSFCASWLIALGAQIKVPFYPAPMTLQTLAIALIALSMPWRASISAVLLYLAYITVGLPVSANGNTGIAALVGPTAGYLWGFLLMSTTIAWLMQTYQPKSVWIKLLFTFIGGSLLFAVGLAYLAHLFGWQAAIKGGLLPFVWSEPTKYALAACLAQWMRNRPSKNLN